MNSIRRRRTMLMTAQSYDCIVALYLHNIFLFTSLLVEFYFSIWTCIWWGKNLFFSIVYILFILSVCMKIKRWLILFSYSYFACTWNENGIKYWKCACIDFQVILYNEWQQKSYYSAKCINCDQCLSQKSFFGWICSMSIFNRIKEHVKDILKLSVIGFSE